jgi:ABC-type lipoprotein release transport system permease subunit
VRPNDPTAVLAAVATMLVLALLASAIPAMRTSRLDPMRMLRED